MNKKAPAGTGAGKPTHQSKLLREPDQIKKALRVLA